MYDYVWLCMTMLCMAIYDYVWQCITIYDNVWLCLTMYDCVWEEERKREREKESKSNLTNFFILLQKISNNLNFFKWSWSFHTFEQTSTLFTFIYIYLPLFSFVYLCLPLFNWRFYAQILCLFFNKSEWKVVFSNQHPSEYQSHTSCSCFHWSGVKKTN